MSRLLFHFLARTACLYTVMLFLVFFTLFTGCSSNIPLRKDFTSKRAINIPDTETPTISYSVKMGSSTDTALDVFLIITAFTIPADRKEKRFLTQIGAQFEASAGLPCRGTGFE